MCQHACNHHKEEWSLKMKYLPFLLLLIFSSPAKAVDFQLELGVFGGGDELANVTFVSGNSESINAGGLLSLSMGLVFDHGDFTTRFKYGIKADTIEATNGSIDWTRNIADLLIMYKATEDVQMGIGLTYHSNVELSGSGVVAGLAEFDNAVGFLAEIDYFWDAKSYIGLSFTSIDYERNGLSFNGNSFGVVIGGIF